MNNYADYEYYKSTYHGSLDSTLFNSKIYKASRIIDNNVNKKITNEDITEQVKYVACLLVDNLHTSDNKDTSVSSITIDGVSKTYKSDSSSELRKQQSDILNQLPQELTRYL